MLYRWRTPPCGICLGWPLFVVKNPLLIVGLSCRASARE
jgi:hypothetical protein